MPREYPSFYVVVNARTVVTMSPLEKMRAFCKTLPDTSERPHFGDAMFYVGKRPFASCSDTDGVVVQLEPDHVATLLQREAGRFKPYTRAPHTVQFDLNEVSEWKALVRESYDLVRVGGKKPKAAKKKPAPRARK